MTRNGDLDDHSSVNVDDSRSKIVLRLGKSTGTGPYDTIITDDTIISDATPVEEGDLTRCITSQHTKFKIDL